MNTNILIRILISSLLFILVHGVELHGDNICAVEEEHEKINLQKHEQTVVLHTTRACFDFTQSFRCKVRSNGTKISYKNIPTKVKNVVYRCCVGFYQTEDATCEICPVGFYGVNCSMQCTNCTDNEICDNVIGCCDPAGDRCGLPRSDYYQEARPNNSWMVGVLVAALCAVALLLFGLVFYRKKYMKEKDPDLPTLTYYPQVKGYLPPSDVESREFNNPLYRQSVSEPTVKLSPEEEDAARNKLEAKRESSMNEYATLDEMSASLAGPSSRDPLLRNTSDYETPLRQISSPESRVRENTDNERKESV